MIDKDFWNDLDIEKDLIEECMAPYRRRSLHESIIERIKNVLIYFNSCINNFINKI